MLDEKLIESIVEEVCRRLLAQTPPEADEAVCRDIDDPACKAVPLLEHPEDPEAL